VSCEQARALVHGYLDGELDAARAAEFERHLEKCPECVTALEEQEALRSTLQRAALYEIAPAELRRKVAAATRGPQRTAVAPLGEMWKLLAVAAALLLMVYAGWRLTPGLRGNEQSVMAAEVVDAHLRALEPGHLTDVISTDQHTVKPWFAGKIDFAPAVQDFSGDGFPLQGGRLDVVHGRTVAALVYGRRKHVISVFVWPAGSAGEANAEARAGSQQGYQWLSWQKDGMEYWAVSDVAAADLDQLRQLIDGR
jgi:mycothiol system anti-sigma-R factor